MIRVVYVAGPYRAATEAEVAANVARASQAARDLLAAGYAPLCPHTMTHHWEDDARFTDADFLLATLDLLRRCDAVLVLDGWQHSEGTLAEIREAYRIGLLTARTVAELASHTLPPQSDTLAVQTLPTPPDDDALMDALIERHKGALDRLAGNPPSDAPEAVSGPPVGMECYPGE